MEKTENKQESHLVRCMQMALKKRETRGIKRILKTLSTSSIDFSSNDFLSLAASPSFRARYLDNLTRASETCRLASTGSRLLDGNSQYAEDLERTITAFHKAPAGLLFTSGFDANVSVFSCVPQPGDVIVYDELIHASTHDGMRKSRAGKRIPFRHNSVTAFEKALCEVTDGDSSLKDGGRSVFVAVESVYSMDGDFAPIREILDVMEKVLPRGNGHMILDEAHATGVFGPRGAGMVQQLGVEDRVFLRLHTFGKALVSNGAIALCTPLTKEYLLNYARPLIFTSAPGLPSLVSIHTAYEFMVQGQTEQLQMQLQDRIRFLRDGLQRIVPLDEDTLLKVRHVPSSPIFVLQTQFPRDLAQICQEHGLIARAIMPPTVAEGTQRVRVCLHAGNTEEQAQRLIDTVSLWLSRATGNQKSKM